MKLPFGLTLSAAEITLLKRVALLSAAVALFTVGAVWAVRFYLIQNSISQNTKPIESASQMYAKTSSCLMPIDVQTHQWAAQHYLETGQAERAVEHLLRVLPLQKDNPTHLFLLAQAYLESGAYAKALALLENLEQEGEPGRKGDAQAMKGMCLFYLNRAEDAREVLNKHLQKYGKSAKAACYLGQIFAAQSTPSDSAEQFFLKAIDWDPSYSEAWYQLARYYMNCNDFRKSRAHLLHVLELEPLHARAHSRLGMAYFYLKQFDLARTTYETALALNPNDFNTLYNLGELHLSLYEHYQEEGFKVAGLESDSIDTETVALQHFGQAIGFFRQTISLRPTHSRALYKAGLLYLTDNKPDSAVVFLQQAAGLENNNTVILLQLAVALERINKNAAALETYKRIIELDVMSPVARQKIDMYSSLPTPSDE